MEQVGVIWRKGGQVRRRIYVWFVSSEVGLYAYENYIVSSDEEGLPLLQ